MPAITHDSRPVAGRWIGPLSDDVPAQWTRELRAALAADSSPARDEFTARWGWLCPAECEVLPELSRRDCADLHAMLRRDWKAPAKATARLARLACIAIPESLLHVLALAEQYHVCFGTALARLEQSGALTYRDGRAVWGDE